MNITPFADDVGVESLKRSNEKASVVPTDKVEPYPAIAPSERKRERSPEEIAAEQRLVDRRKGERRERQQPTTLDTRDHHDRRQRREPREDGEEQAQPHGLDEFA